VTYDPRGGRGEPIQASPHDVRLLEHRDVRSGAGPVGLWMKADAVTAFDDLSIRNVPGSAEATQVAAVHTTRERDTR